MCSLLGLLIVFSDFFPTPVCFGGTSVSPLRNIFLVFKIFRLIIQILFMLMFPQYETSKRDQLLMKLRSDFEIACSNLMNRHPVPSLDACLSKLLLEE